jgi:antiviral helicase SLH1
MNDALNAEISLGTVSNINDAVQWLGYTYLFVRARKNPMAYGTTPLVIWLPRDINKFLSGMLMGDVADDPGLGVKRNQLVTNAVRRLVEARMVNWNSSTATLKITDLGNIAAKYYIRIASIEIFNEQFKPKMSEADVLTMLCHSTEVRWLRPLLSVRFLTIFRT